VLWSRNLQLHYPFENQANDYSGNARHGTVVGSGVYATRPNAGRCLYFDGVGDYVTTPSFGLPANHTVVVFACWTRCKLHAAVRQEFIGDNSEAPTVGYFHFYRYFNSGDLYWKFANGSASAFVTSLSFFNAPYDDVWLHLAVVCDYVGKLTYFYRNGVLFSTSGAMSGTPIFPSTDRVKYIGSYNNAQNLLTAGYLQNVQLWTLATMPPLAAITANANRLMLGMNPIWSV